MTAKTKTLPPCPWCGGVVTTDVGLIVEPGITGYGESIRIKRLGKFSACTGCEFAVEGTWDGTAVMANA